eukprot:4720959-Amphidinium_carterae.2
MAPSSFLTHSGHPGSVKNAMPRGKMIQVQGVGGRVKFRSSGNTWLQTLEPKRPRRRLIQ